MKKRILAILLVSAILMSMLPVQVFATETGAEAPVQTEQHIQETVESTVVPNEDTEKGIHRSTAGAHVHPEEGMEYAIPLSMDNIADYNKAFDNGEGVAHTALHSGYYYLTEDVITVETLRIPYGGEVHLCLCGFTLTSRVNEGIVNFTLTNNSELHLYDCTGKGELLVYSTNPGVGTESGYGRIYIYEGATINNLYKDSDYSATTSWKPNSGVILCGGTFRTIAGEHTGYDGYGSGAGIENNANGSYADLRSGLLINEGRGYGVEIAVGTGDLYMSGDVVMTHGEGAADIVLGRNAVVKFRDGMPLTPPEGETYAVRTRVRVTPKNPVCFTNGWPYAQIDGWTPYISADRYAVMYGKDLLEDEAGVGDTELHMVIPRFFTNVVSGEGTATVSSEYGWLGDQVTFTATPAEGYVIDKMTLKYRYMGYAFTESLIPDANGQVTLTIPNAHLTVDVEFAEANTHRHYMAVDTVNGGEYADGGQADVVKFAVPLTQADVPLSGNMTLNPGTYVLMEDLILPKNSDLLINGDVDLCLYGHDLIMDGEGAIEYSAKGRLRICDCVKENGYGSGKIEGAGPGAVILPSHEGSIEMYNVRLFATGIYENSTVPGATKASTRGIYMINGQSAKLEDCRVQIDSGSNDAFGVYNYQSDLKIYDGEFFVTATNESATGIYGVVMDSYSSKVNTNVLIKGTKFTVNSTSYSYGVQIRGGIPLYPGFPLSANAYGTITDAKIYAYSNSTNGVCAVACEDSAEVSLTNCEMIAKRENAVASATMYGICCNTNAKVTVNGGSVLAENDTVGVALFAVGGAAATVKDCELTAISKVSSSYGAWTTTDDNGGGSISLNNCDVFAETKTPTRWYDEAYGVYADFDEYADSNTALVELVDTRITATMGGSTGKAYGIRQETVVKMKGNMVITSDDGDISLAADKVITIHGLLIPPRGEVYTVFTDIKPTATVPVPVTEMWDKNHNATYPGGTAPGKQAHFMSIDGYFIGNLNGSTNPVHNRDENEVYLYIPVIEDPVPLYLWKGHSVETKASTLVQTINLCDNDGEKLYIDSIAIDVATLGLTMNGSIDSDYQWITNKEGQGTAKLKLSVHDEGNPVSIPIIATLDVKAFDVKDSVFVIDYGVDMKLDAHVYNNDTLPGTAYGLTATDSPDTLLKMESLAEGAAIPSRVLTKAMGTYGEFTYNGENGQTVYSPNTIMDGGDEVYVVFRAYHKDATAGKLGEADPHKEVEMYKKITVLPANVVYYEDDYLSFNKNTGNVISPVNSTDGVVQEMDPNAPYGSDSNYAQYGENYTGSLGSSTTIQIREFGEVMSFDFTGTGFDIVGSVAVNGGIMMVDVTNSSDEVVYSATFDTVYREEGAKITETPLVHKMGLPHDSYHVSVTVMPLHDFDGNVEWEEITLPDGTTVLAPPLIDSYLYIDGVRIYNALAEEDALREYYAEGEQNAKFVQIRDLIMEGKAAAARLVPVGSSGGYMMQFGSGTISYTEKAGEQDAYQGNTVTTLENYLVYGHNNEVFFNTKAQSLVLYVRKTEEAKKAMLQIALRNLNSAAYAGDAVNPSLVLLGSHGGVVQTLLSEDRAVSYSQQYYTVDFTKCPVEVFQGKDYYRVVLSAGNGGAFAMTDLKYSNVEFYNIPNQECTFKYDEHGMIIETDSGDPATMPNLALLAQQLQALNGTLPEMEVEPKPQEALQFASVSLSLQSSISMNFYVLQETLKNYKNPYVVFEKEVFGEDGTVTWETMTVETFEEAAIGEKEALVFTFDNIYAKEMGNTVRATIYATDAEGVAVQGETREYSVLAYAKNMLAKYKDNTKLCTLLVDMLNYGGEAQSYFHYNENHLVTDELTEEEKSFATVAVPELSNEKVDTGESYTVKIAGITLSLESKVEMNFYVNTENFVGEKEKLVLEVRYENVLGNPVLAEVPYTSFEQVSENNYKIVFDGLNATDFRRICDARITENGRAVSNYMSYSIETYAYNRVQDETKPELAALMVAMMKYGDSTAAYFAK